MIEKKIRDNSDSIIYKIYNSIVVRAKKNDYKYEAMHPVENIKMSKRRSIII